MKKKLFILLMLIGCLSASAQQGYWAGVDYIELTPDESIVYRYVQAMDEESDKKDGRRVRYSPRVLEDPPRFL